MSGIIRIGRRRLLKGGIAAGIGLGLSPRPAESQDDQAAAMRPRPGDLLVREGDETRTPLTPADIVADGKPTVAWAMDPDGKVVRNASRFNKLVVVRVGAGDDAVFANTVICTHDGCDVTDWLGDEHVLSCPCHYSKFDPKDAGRVISGPAPRALPSLPLTVTNGRLVVARPFTSRVGFESQ
jgi:rieske iron-sulfur protein